MIIPLCIDIILNALMFGTILDGRFGTYLNDFIRAETKDCCSACLKTQNKFDIKEDEDCHSVSRDFSQLNQRRIENAPFYLHWKTMTITHES